MDRLVGFLSLALRDRNLIFTRVDDKTYDLASDDGTRKRRFTLDRNIATSSDTVDLMGLDHPVLQEELGRWRSLPPEQLGVAVQGDGDGLVLLSNWLVESSAANGGKRVFIQSIAISADGSRMPSIERLATRYLQNPAATPRLTAQERLELFTSAVEPTLQRELKHKGAANGDGSYSAELIGYVEIV